MQSFEVGGLERMVATLVEAGLGRGESPAVAAYVEDGPIRQTLDAMGAETWRLRYSGGLDPSLSLQLLWLLRRGRFTHLHTHHVGPFLYGAPAARLAGVVHVHTEHSHEWYDTPRRRLAGRLMDEQARVACVSEEIAAWRSERLGCPTAEVVPNGVAFDAVATTTEARTRLGLAPRAQVVGSVGRLAREKGHRVLVDAFVELRERLPEARLVIVGDGPERVALERRCEDLGLQGEVTFTGCVEDPRAFLPAFDVFALPSLREGLPLAVLEASAQGLPFVASDVGELPVLAQEGAGLVVPPRDVSALSRALLSSLTDRVGAARRGEAGRRLVSARYSVDAMVRGYDELYGRPLARAA
jgi:glycosyltransferase involved in cell wall biosynthesis